MSLDGSDNPHAALDADVAPACSPGIPRRESVRLGFFFGILYFIQGISEPTEGLIAQPVRSLLDRWGHTASEIGLFGMVLSLPWAIKPLFGFISDFVPLGGRRRKSYLMLSSAAAFLGLIALYAAPPQQGSITTLLLVLLVPTVGVAFGDVVVDALMVERGQPLGLTGYLQSVQWASNYGATLLTGVVGGYLSHLGRQDIGFLICAAVSIPAFVMALRVRESAPVSRTSTWREARHELWQGVTTPGVLAVGAFLFLWNFNPFSTSVLQLHMKHELQLGDRFYGTSVSIQAGAAVLACLAYGFYCRRVPMKLLIHGSIVLGILATVGYWAMYDQTSAVIVSVAVGFIYMTATLIQFDLAAQVCPPRTAGTVFATLMALMNLGTALSMGLGGKLYDYGVDSWGSRTTSFQVLVGIGAAFTAGCWLIVPFLQRGPPGSTQVS